MKHILPLAALTLLAAPAYSGGLVLAPAPVVESAAPSSLDANWTSNYAGVILGYGELNRETSGGEDSDKGVAGAFTLGHMRDFGSWVGAVELMGGPGFNAEVAGREVNWGVAARVKGGFKFGPESRWLGFASLGVGRVKTEDSETGDSRNANGYVYGIGINHLLNDKIMVGAELNRFEKNGDGDADGTGIGASLAYRF